MQRFESSLQNTGPHGDRPFTTHGNRNPMNTSVASDTDRPMSAKAKIEVPPGMYIRQKIPEPEPEPEPVEIPSEDSTTEQEIEEMEEYAFEEDDFDGPDTENTFAAPPIPATVNGYNETGQ